MIDDMAVYIANLGKYNEGYLVGAWFTFPIDEEDVKEKIGLNEQQMCIRDSADTGQNAPLKKVLNSGSRPARQNGYKTA